MRGIYVGIGYCNIKDLEIFFNGDIKKGGKGRNSNNNNKKLAFNYEFFIRRYNRIYFIFILKFLKSIV